MTPVPKRLRPLQAEPQHDPARNPTRHALEAEAEMEALAEEVIRQQPSAASFHDPAAEARRHQRLALGVQQLRAGSRLRLGERVLMIIGGVLAPLGLIAVLIGWWGAARTPYLFEQIPYAISGGLFGLGLVFVGCFCYFAHWITELVKEHRVQSASVVEAIGRLEEAIRTTAATGAVVPASGEAVAAPTTNGLLLVATERGTMAHRPDCVVVAGKSDLRAVSPTEGLAPCKLCDSYASLATN